MELPERLPSASPGAFRSLLNHLRATGETSLYGVEFSDLTDEQVALVLTVLCDNAKKTRPAS